MSNPLIERRVFATRRGITLRRWRLQNFKSVRNAEVELRPLTVIVGANSAGKSTLLQSIRAASQASGSTGYLYPLNGRGVRLGTVSEVKYRGPGSDDEPLILGADFEIQAPRGMYRDSRPPTAAQQAPVLATLSWEVKLGESSQQKGIAKIERLNVDLKPEDRGTLPRTGPRLDRAWVLAIADDDAESLIPLDDDDDTVSIPHYFTGQFSGANGNLLEIVDILVTGGFPQDASVMRPRAEVLFETWRDMLLRRSIHEREEIEHDLFSVVDAIEEVSRDLLSIHASASKAKIEYSDAVRFELSSKAPETRSKIDLNIASSETFSDSIVSELTKSGVTGEVPFPHRLDDLGRASNLASSFLEAGIRYLGPLREEPRAAYPDSPEGDDTYVGSKGEFTASVLQRHGDRKVGVPTPDDDGVIKTPRRPIQLMTAVSRWAKFLDIGESFSVSDQGRFGIQMQVRQADVQGDLDLTSVGTGVSQLLPVIVMCVQAPVGSLLLIEQPELHLNPKVQQRLADFLLAIAESGRHLIVETHSEYLISRLRRRVAEDEKDNLQDTIGIYFAKRVNGATTYDLVQQNEYGGIEEWPENFFDQATEEEHAILSAAVKKRRAKAAKIE
ncbi:AAA family ATPase [Microbacterium aureliae]